MAVQPLVPVECVVAAVGSAAAAAPGARLVRLLDDIDATLAAVVHLDRVSLRAYPRRRVLDEGRVDERHDSRASPSYPFGEGRQRPGASQRHEVV